MAAIEMGARRRRPRTVEWEHEPVESHDEPWLSTIAALDHRCGGFYGISVIAGGTGCQKTTTALQSALRAAADGTRVLYVGAELDELELARLIRQIVDAHPTYKRAVGTFKAIDICGDLTEDDLSQLIEESMQLEDERLLIVLDSINTICAWSDEDYWTAYRNVARWAMTVKKASRGAVRFLVVSELNQRGEIKGLNMEYWADLVLLVTREDRDEEFSSKFKLLVSKARRGHQGNLGEFCYEWPEKRWIRELI
jgi:predicted ATP-dependent serine protease